MVTRTLKVETYCWRLVGKPRGLSLDQPASNHDDGEDAEENHETNLRGMDEEVVRWW